MLSAINNPKVFPFLTEFNEDPFELGNFDTIATFKGGRGGRAKYFKVGYRLERRSSYTAHEVEATFVSERGQPILSELSAEGMGGKGTLMMTQKGEGKTLHGDIEILKEDKSKHKFSFDTKIDESDYSNLGSLIYTEMIKQIRANQEKDSSDNLILTAYRLFNELSPQTAVSIAPIRSKPKRTYDQVSDTFNPEGTHIPFLLAKHFNKSSPQKVRDMLKKNMDKFGNESGLFSSIKVKQLGERLVDPFQITVTISGKSVNVSDVGYGVSQALPVIVESVLLAKGNSLLLQQPEVHLHPRAQAALGTFFVDLVRDQKEQIIVETHSDYILDRIRQEIVRGRLDSNQFSILFFDRQHMGTTIHQLLIDRTGNVIGAPPTYRSFFLREELNLLKRTEPS